MNVPMGVDPDAWLMWVLVVVFMVVVFGVLLVLTRKSDRSEDDPDRDRRR